ncbi:MAG: sulfatase [Chloroflexi bacterium]|nr:sulfatase [Chloroflexota bacterium]
MPIPTTRPPQLNVLYLHSHDTGRYIQPYGHAIPTPNLQRLAEEGVLFRQNFCAAPTCSPSRACLLTGQAAHSCGMFGLAHRGFPLLHPEHHLAHVLRMHGYHTALMGVQHVTSDPAGTGYEVVVRGKRESTQITAAATEFLRNAPREPFFLDVGYGETHREFRQPGAAEDARYCLPPAPLPDTPQTRTDMAAFKASARVLDSNVGTVLAALERQGLADRTLVISTTDHGIAFPGMKCNLTDHGMGVSLIVRGPGGFEGGRVIDAMVSHLDLFPTISELAGIPRPDWLQGTSLLPLVRGEVEQLYDELFAEVNYHAAYEPQRAVRTARWKYIRRYGEQETPVLPNCDDGLSKDLWLEHGWRERSVGREQLYDLVFDPYENNNLAADSTYSAVLSELGERLDRWMERTDDPLRYGPIPIPEGAWANDPSGLSPREPKPAF